MGGDLEKDLDKEDQDKEEGLAPTGELSLSSENEKSEKRLQPHSGALEAFNAYNELAQRVALPVARSLDPRRKNALLKLLKDNGADAWKTMLANVEQSPILRGENDRGWRPTLDWFLQPVSFRKVIEGAYEDAAKREREKRKKIFEEIEQSIQAKREEIDEKREARKALERPWLEKEARWYLPHLRQGQERRDDSPPTEAEIERVRNHYIGKYGSLEKAMTAVAKIEEEAAQRRKQEADQSG